MAEEKELSPDLLLAKSNVLARIDKIEQTLKTMDPLLPVHCENIQKTLLEYEELVHILPDDKIRMFMAGMQKYKNIVLVEEASKKRARGKVTADDL
jgi:hypothetical protein